MSNDTQIVVVGSHAPGIFVRVKRVPQAGETVIGWDFQEPMDGGKGSNQAIAAGLLGCNVSFVGCVGRDRIGDDGEKWMRSAGVDTSWLKRHETISSGVGFIILDENGVPAMVTSLGANAEIQERDIEQAYHDMPNAKVMLTQFEIPIDTALFAARQAKQRGMVVLLNPAPAPEGAIERLDVADILLPNETEAQVLLGMEPGQAVEPRQMAIALRERSGVPVVIITLGEKGILGVDDKGVWTVSVPEVEVVDTSGAGDVFCAALAAGLSTGMELRQASWWACLAASFSVTKGGTIPAYPTLDELQKFINSQEIIVREI